MKVLFLGQGRAMPSAALGHVRVKHALAAGLAGVEEELEYAELDVPPFTRLQRRFAWTYLPLIGEWNLGSVKWHLARGWAARRLLKRVMAANPPDLVHITTPQVSFLLGDLQDKVPCVLSLDTLMIDWVRMTHHVAPDAETPGSLKPIAWLERRALTRAPLCIAWTDTAARRVRELAPEARVTTLHPGLDLTAFARRDGRRDGPPRVLFVGGRWEAKGGPDLLAALQPALAEGRVALDVVTTEPVDAPPGVTLHSGKPGSSQVADLFGRADVLCLPTRIDAVPWVALEAMASGLPVVSTGVGSIPEMIEGCGAIVAPGDVDGLRDTLERLIADPGLRASLGAAGRARAEERYDARKNTPALVELLRGVASAPTTRSTIRRAA